MHRTGLEGEARVASNGTQDTEKFAADPNITGETIVITVTVWTVNVALYLCYSGSGKQWLHRRDSMKFRWMMKAVFKAFLLSLLTRPIFQNSNLSNGPSKPQLSEAFFDHSIKLPPSCTDDHAWSYIPDWSCHLFASRSQRLLFAQS